MATSLLYLGPCLGLYSTLVTAGSGGVYVCSCCGCYRHYYRVAGAAIGVTGGAAIGTTCGAAVGIAGGIGGAFCGASCGRSCGDSCCGHSCRACWRDRACIDGACTDGACGDGACGDRAYCRAYYRA